MCVAFWCCQLTVGKLEAHQALPCIAVVRTMYEHMQLRKLASAAKSILTLNIGLPICAMHSDTGNAHLDWLLPCATAKCCVSLHVHS